MSWLKIQLPKVCSAFNHQNLPKRQGVELLCHPFLSRWRLDGLTRRYFTWTSVLRLFCFSRWGHFKGFSSGLLPITGDYSEICLTNYAFRIALHRWVRPPTAETRREPGWKSAVLLYNILKLKSGRLILRIEVMSQLKAASPGLFLGCGRHCCQNF